MSTARLLCVPSVLVFVSWAALAAQDPQEPPGGGRPGFGGPPGPGGPGGPQVQLQVKQRFDADANGWLDATERTAARAWLVENRPRGRRGPGGPPGGGGRMGPGGEGAERGGEPKVGVRVAPDDVPHHGDRPLFDPDIVRTFFVELPEGDWFAELSAFHRTDVEVPATVVVDGQTYRNVGVQFRGNTSFGMARGRKKSLDLTFDLVDRDQRLLGVRNLDLLNCNADASSLREMLHGHVATQFFAAPRVALARVVVNGEDHGVYAAVEQFDKEFVRAHFGTKGGDRFKVPPDFGGGGGLRHLGDDPAAYRRNYELKSAESPAAWQGLIDLCAALERTPDDQLEAVLPRHLDVDATLWFLAVDNALGDDDGYHSRASDYLLYRDPSGRFHPIPRDNNEILLAPRRGGPGGPGGPGGERRPGAGGEPGDARPVGAGERRPGGGGEAGGERPVGSGGERRPGGGGEAGGERRPVAGGGDGNERPTGPGGGAGGPGMRRGPGGPGGGAASKPLDGAARADRPLLKRLLAVPAWRARYLANLRTLAEGPLAEAALAPRLASWRALLEPLVQIDAHSLYGHDAFVAQFAVDEAGQPAPRSLLAIVAQRRRAILDDPALQGAWPQVAAPQIAATRQDDGAFVVVVTCAAKDAATVRVHAGEGAFGAFTTHDLVDDGEHGDGARGDGVFGGRLPPIAAGGTWRYWVEAIAADSGHVACQPLGNGASPLRWTAPGKGKRD